MRMYGALMGVQLQGLMAVRGLNMYKKIILIIITYYCTKAMQLFIALKPIIWKLLALLVRVYYEVSKMVLFPY